MVELPPIDIDAKKFLREQHRLPALPKIITAIQELMVADNFSIKKIAEIIKKDPGVVAEVLKIVNSAYYGLSTEIGNVSHAVAYMGINEVYRIVLSIEVFKNLDCEDIEAFNQVWFHSFFTALSAKFLAEKFEPLLPMEELWSGAILHDIGKLVYLKFFPDHYRALLQYTKDQGCLFYDAEKHYQLPTSSTIGALLCDYWRLPNKIRSACLHHSLNDLQEIQGDSTSDAFSRIICLANLLSVIAVNSLNKETVEHITQTIQTTMNWSESDFMIVMGSIYELKLEAEKFT